MRGTGRIKKAFLKARRRFRPAAIILMYHRVADVPIDPRGTAVSPGRFAQHLEYIRQTCHPMRLLDLVEAVRQRSLPRRAVAVTFDDGYADNLTRAYPLLASAQIPATVFVVSGSVNSSDEFWWDRLDRLLLQPPRLPERLHIRVPGQEHEWPTTSAKQRQLAHHAIRHLLRTLAPEDRDRVLVDLVRWAGPEQTGWPDCRPMTDDELIQLTRGGLVELGAHTVTHPVLADLSADEQHAEIVGSRQDLEGIIHSPVLAFVYPYGQAQHFTDETVEIVKAAGFRAACTAIQGSVEPGEDLFRLRRCEVRDWDLETFKRYLEWVFVF